MGHIRLKSGSTETVAGTIKERAPPPPHAPLRLVYVHPVFCDMIPCLLVKC